VAKDLLTSLAFATKFNPQVKTDEDDVLVIPRGSNNGDGQDVDRSRELFRTHFGQEVDYAVGASTSDPADDPNFADELIDSRRLGKVDGPTSRRASVDDL